MSHPGEKVIVFWCEGTRSGAGQTTTYMILAVRISWTWLRPDMVMGLPRSVEDLNL